MNWSHAILDAGIDEKLHSHQKRRAQLTNRLILFGTALCLPYIFFYINFIDKTPLYLLVFFVVFNALLFYFSKNQRHEVAAILFILSASLFLYGISLSISNSSFHYFLIPMSVLGFAMIEKKRAGILTFLLAVVVFFLAATTDYYFEPLIQINERTELVFYVINFIAVFLASLYFFWQLKLTNVEFEENLKDQKNQIEDQHKQLKTSFREIQESINYAKHIQHAILPASEKVNSLLNENFVLYRPKDVVAGDFYFLEEVNGVRYVAVADCTGHGVPGAMVSVVCNQALNRAIREFGLKSTGEVLDKTRELVVSELNRSDSKVMDGMDIAFCALYDNKLEFSGANNPLWIFRNNEMINLKGDKQPVGKFEFKRPFNTQIIELKKDDFVVMSTDGFYDQFGGDKGKKLKTKNFIDKLMSISSYPAKQQKAELSVFLNNWMDGYEQVDDICVLGFRV